jgi:hypothetical protein
MLASMKKFREWWLRDAKEREALEEKLTERDQMLEHERDAAAAAWNVVECWEEWCKAAEAALEEERQQRDELIRLEVDRLTGREPKRRGRPPSWSADSEAEVERMHRAGASIRQIAADLHASKTQVHRVVARVRRQQVEAQERAQLVAIASGRSPKQRAAWAAKQTAKRRPPEEYDPARAERGVEYLRNLPDDDE